MLEYEQYIPDNVSDGAPLIILLHGRGSDETDLMHLQPHLPQIAMLIAPRAPFSGAEMGYGSGYAWYRFLGRDLPETSSFEQGQQALDAFLRGLPATLPVKPGITVLGGFSQGAVSSMGYALRNPGQIPLILNFSGYIPRNPSVRVTPETVRGTRFFWGHGTQDQMIPFQLAQEGRALLHEAGADLEAHDYPIGHWIDPKELQDAVAWLNSSIKLG